MGKAILDVPDGRYEIYGAMWPLRHGHEEGRMFMLSPASYGEWLHEKQEIDACYWPIAYGIMEDGQSAAGLTGFSPFRVPAIFPGEVQPEGYTIRDTQNGRNIPVTQWLITVKDDAGMECEISYAEFLDRLPADKISRYDSDKILIQPMTG